MLEMSLCMQQGHSQMLGIMLMHEMLLHEMTSPSPVPYWADKAHKHPCVRWVHLLTQRLLLILHSS